MIEQAVDHKRNSFLFTPLLAFIVLDLSYPYTQMHHEAALQAAFYIAFVLQVGHVTTNPTFPRRRAQHGSMCAMDVKTQCKGSCGLASLTS